MANNNKTARGANRRAGNSRPLSDIDKTEALAKELGITKRTKEFYDEIIKNPKQTQKQAYIKTHDVSEHNNSNSASVLASKLLNSDKYQIYKASAVGKAKRRIVALVESDNENIALKASQDILDRTEGKATQKDETKSTVVRVELDITGAKLGNHYLTPEQRT